MIDWSKLVQERDAWVARNFPPYEGEIPGQDSILGCIEELGELAHAHLKGKQGIRGTREEHEAAARDAIGDLMVYLLGVMSSRGYMPDDPKHVFIPPESDEDCILKMRTGIAHLPRLWGIDQLIHHSQVYCEFNGWDFENIVNTTWAHVKERDWVAHRKAGAPREDESMGDPEVERIRAEADAINPRRDIPQ